jgi:hypothetical protein
MEKREFDREQLAATCLRAPAIPLYPSKTFAGHLTSSQSAPDRKRGGTQRSLQFPCRSERETMAEVLFGSFTMVGSQIRDGK